MFLLFLPLAHGVDLVAFSEDFDSSSVSAFSGTTGWMSGYTSDPWATAANDGVYAVKDDADGTWGANTPIDDHLVYTLGSWSDFTYDLTLYAEGGDTSGVVFRYQDQYNFYLFFLTTDKMPDTGNGGQATGSGAYLYVVEDGVATELAADAGVKWGGAEQRVEVVVAGDSLEVWLDEDYSLTIDRSERVFKVTDTTLASGGVGLYCYNNGSYAGTLCRFDDVEVSVADTDSDGVADGEDNCPDDANSSQSDLDGDGLGDACDDDADGDGYTNGADCDDSRDDVNPGVDERCTTDVDDDCDGSTNTPAGIGCSGFFADRDGDGYGDTADALCLCVTEGDHTATAGGDCDDDDAAIKPGQAEVCDDVDQDCDGGVDEGATDRGAWYADADGDSFGDPTTEALACDAPAGWVADANDCDDHHNTIFPGAAETCDDVDQDCDEVVDEDAVDAPTWFFDGDADGFGDPATTLSACDAPDGYRAEDGDCDDGSADVYPGAPEHCDGVDEDCDGAVDSPDPVDGQVYYLDADGDGFGDGASVVSGCEPPPGAVDNADDCDDTDADVFPGAPEVVNASDDDCDGRRDDGYDSDGDGLDDDTEFEDYGTDPHKPDSDGGGVPDGTEVVVGTDPLDGGDDERPVKSPDEAGPRTGSFYGGACSTVPGMTLGGLPLVALLVLRRRKV